jgi:hypothetical protein
MAKPIKSWTDFIFSKQGGQTCYAKKIPVVGSIEREKEKLENEEQTLHGTKTNPSTRI